MSDLLTPSNAKKPGIGSLFTCRVNDDKKRLECVKKASFSLLFLESLNSGFRSSTVKKDYANPEQ